MQSIYHFGVLDLNPFRHRWHKAHQHGGADGGDHCRRVPPQPVQHLRLQQQQGHHPAVWHEGISPLRPALQEWVFLLLHLHWGNSEDAFIQSDLQWVHLSEERETILFCRYSKDVHGTKCQPLTSDEFTRSLYAIKIASGRCYTMLSTIFKCKGIQHTLSARTYNIQ